MHFPPCHQRLQRTLFILTVTLGNNTHISPSGPGIDARAAWMIPTRQEFEQLEHKCAITNAYKANS